MKGTRPEVLKNIQHPCQNPEKPKLLEHLKWTSLIGFSAEISDGKAWVKILRGQEKEKNQGFGSPKYPRLTWALQHHLGLCPVLPFLEKPMYSGKPTPGGLHFFLTVLSEVFKDSVRSLLIIKEIARNTEIWTVGIWWGEVRGSEFALGHFPDLPSGLLRLLCNKGDWNVFCVNRHCLARK